MNIQSKKSIIEDFKSLSNNPFINKNAFLLILYYDRDENSIKAGWCEPYEYKTNENNIIMLPVAKSRSQKLTDKEYNKYIETLKLKIKMNKIDKAIERMTKDFE